MITVARSVSQKLREMLHARPVLHRSFKFVRSIPSLNLSSILRVADHKLAWSVMTHSMLPLGRMIATIDLVVRVNRESVTGDIVECGVWSGGSLGLMALADSRDFSMRRYVGFDSFEGLPAPTIEDAEVFDTYSSERKPESVVLVESMATRTAIGACVGAREPEVRQFLVDNLGLPEDRLELHAGWFVDTLPRWAESRRPIALLRIDGDWYRSSMDCLENLYDLVQPGGIVTVDDYGAFSGCRKAVDEFLDRLPVKPEIHFIDAECIWFRK